VPGLSFSASIFLHITGVPCVSFTFTPASCCSIDGRLVHVSTNYTIPIRQTCGCCFCCCTRLSFVFSFFIRGLPCHVECNYAGNTYCRSFSGAPSGLDPAPLSSIPRAMCLIITFSPIIYSFSSLPKILIPQSIYTSYYKKTYIDGQEIAMLKIGETFVAKVKEHLLSLVC